MSTRSRQQSDREAGADEAPDSSVDLQAAVVEQFCRS